MINHVTIKHTLFSSHSFNLNRIRCGTQSVNLGHHSRPVFKPTQSLLITVVLYQEMKEDLHFSMVLYDRQGKGVKTRRQKSLRRQITSFTQTGRSTVNQNKSVNYFRKGVRVTHRSLNFLILKTNKRKSSREPHFVKKSFLSLKNSVFLDLSLEQKQ